jgi:predicted O-methyltransferase YrrM
VLGDQVTYPNWFQQVGADQAFARHLLSLPAEPTILQIGAFTGDASVWILGNLPHATLLDVDTWGGSEGEQEHSEFDWADVEATYDKRVHGAYGSWRAYKYKMTSDEFFEQDDVPMFDFIYIDGAHTFSQVLKDANNAASHIAPGGIIAFDDYTWGLSLPPSQRPHDAINAFLAQYDGKYTLLEKGLQVWVRWDG